MCHPDLCWRFCNEFIGCQTAIYCGVISRDEMQGIPAAGPEALARVEKCAVPFDGSWLDATRPTLHEIWDKI